MAESVSSIVGKGFEYEERVQVTTLYDRIETTIGAFVGAANWGPTNVATKVYKNFKTYYGTEVNRDQNSKDYSGMTASKFLKYSGMCLFTRIADGTDTKATKILMKLAKSAALIGEESIIGRTLKVTDECNRYITSLNGGADVISTLSLTPAAGAITSSVMPLSITDPLAVNYSVGNYFEFYVDGTLYQHIISSATSILCRLTVADDSSFGGKAGENVITYVDRLVYALKNVVIGSGDPARLIRKTDTNAISVNSQERGSSSSIRINSFPVVFPTATSSSPLQSLTMNARVEDIITQINAAIIANGSAFIDSSGKYKTQTSLTGVSTSICVKDDTQINLTSFFTNNYLVGAGLFETDPSASWTSMTNGMIAALNFFTNQTTSFNNTVSGVAATSGSQSWGFTTAKTSSSATGLANNATTYTCTITVDGIAKSISVVGSAAQTMSTLISEINTDLAASATATWVATGNGFIKITSATTGASSTVAISDTNLFSTLTDHNAAAEAAIAGAAATSGYAEIIFPSSTLVSADESMIPAGAYIIRVTVDAGSATDHTVTFIGNETWGQVASMIATATGGCTGSIVGGRIRITSSTTGTSSVITLAEGTAAATGMSLTYNAGTKNVNIVSTGSNKLAQRLAQKFTVSTTDAYSKMELYFTPSGGSYTTGITKLSVYKGRNRIATRTVVTADLGAPVRIEFYGLGAGLYTMAFEVATENTATTLIIDNLYVGPYRNLRNNNLLNALGIKSNDGSYDLTYDAVLRPENLFLGTDANLNMGTFQAYYTGSDGNLITITKSTDVNGIETMVFAFDGDVIGRITNFSYVTTDPLFFGSLINNDEDISKYITYIAPSPLPATIEKIENGEYTLSGGTSGIDNITDNQYAIALDTYKNLDIYDVDIICVTGNSTGTVKSAIQNVCDYRKDCFGVFDPPEVVAGKPGGVPTGGANAMVYWHNGLMPALLSEKLDSKYISTYFPWVLVDADSSSNTRQWHAPSIAVVPVIARCDLENTPYAAPAGNKAYINDIYDIAYYLEEEQKGKMYDDIIGNNINPIVYTSRQGFFIDGQKTTQRERNAYNRINVMRISLFIKRRLFGIVPQFFYQPITKDTFARFKASIEANIMSILEMNNAIKPGWTVTVDSSVNSTIVEAQGGMIAVIEFEPRKVLEKIKVISIMKDTQVTVQF
jgi:hypothetical protein